MHALTLAHAWARRGGARDRRWTAFVFHPYLPFAISVQMSQQQSPVVSFHFRW